MTSLRSYSDYRQDDPEEVQADADDETDDVENVGDTQLATSAFHVVVARAHNCNNVVRTSWMAFQLG